MALTPHDVHTVTFAKSPIGRRGYDEDQVDTFLDVVEAELTTLLEEIDRLGAHTAGPDTNELTVVQPAPAPPASAATSEGQMTRIFALATEAAERYTDEAKATADAIVEDAKRRADEAYTARLKAHLEQHLRELDGNLPQGDRIKP